MVFLVIVGVGIGVVLVVVCDWCLSFFLVDYVGVMIVWYRVYDCEDVFDYVVLVL